MNSLRLSHFHSQCSSNVLQLRTFQKRWARVHDVRFLATHNADERIIGRYKAKLEEKAKARGVDDISQLKEVYKHEISAVRKTIVAKPTRTLPSSQSPSPWPLPPNAPESNVETTQQSSTTPQPLDQLPQADSEYSTPGVKTLSSFLDMSKTIELPPREIESIWRLRHVGKPLKLAATIPAPTFTTIYQNARKHPQFILPGLPRKSVSVDANGTESKTTEEAPIHYVQWTFPSPETVTVLFTHLAEFKLRGEYSQPHTTLTHHTELSGPKGLVLAQGNVIPERGVTVEEAKWLVMNLQKFYNVGEELEKEEQSSIGKELKKKRRRLVEMFSQGDEQFRVEDLLEEAERLG